MFRRKRKGPPGRLDLRDFIVEDQEEERGLPGDADAEPSCFSVRSKDRAPLQCEDLLEMINEHEPEELVVRLSVESGWSLLLDSPFNHDELRVIISALRKCCTAPLTNLLEKFLSDIFAMNQNVHARCATLLPGLKRKDLKILKEIVSVLEVIDSLKLAGSSKACKTLLDAVIQRCDDPLNLDRKKGKGISTQHASIKENIKLRARALCGTPKTPIEPKLRENRRVWEQTAVSAPRSRRDRIANRARERLRGYCVLREN